MRLTLNNTFFRYYFLSGFRIYGTKNTRRPLNFRTGMWTMPIFGKTIVFRFRRVAIGVMFGPLQQMLVRNFKMPYIKLRRPILNYCMTYLAMHNGPISVG